MVRQSEAGGREENRVVGDISGKEQMNTVAGLLSSALLHTDHVAPYFRGLPPNKGFSAKIPLNAP